MKIIVSFLLFMVVRGCFGTTNSNAITVGDWSQPVTGLRARLLASTKPEEDGRRGIVYLELKNVSTNGESMEVYSGFLLKGELVDSSGEPPRAATWFRSGPSLDPPSYLAIPYNASVKVRVDDPHMWAVGDVGTSLNVGSHCWLIRDKDHTEYFLSGTLTLPSPSTPDVPLRGWRGALKLPKVKIPHQSPKP